MSNETTPKWRQNFYDNRQENHFRPIISNEKFISEQRQKYPNSQERQSVSLIAASSDYFDLMQNRQKTTQNLEKLAKDLLNAEISSSSSSSMIYEKNIENGIKGLKLLVNPQQQTHLKTIAFHSNNKPTAQQQNKQQILAGNSNFNHLSFFSKKIK